MITFDLWLLTLKRAFTFRRVRQRQFYASRKKPLRSRLNIEVLEDRSVPSTVSWVGGTSGDWDLAKNWSTGHLPGAGDDVVISTANATITHAGSNTESINSLTTGSTDKLSWSNGTLRVSSPSTLNGPVNLSGGTWKGAGSLTLNGLLTWTGGTMSGSGVTTANAGIALSGNSTSETLDGRTLNNGNGTTSSTATWSGSNDLYLQNGAAFNNKLHSTFNINNSQNFLSTTFTTGTFSNAGTVTKSLSSGISNLEVLLANSGTINVNSGELNVTKGGNSIAGTIAVASPATLAFTGGLFKEGSTATISGTGTVVMGATEDITGTYNVTGSTVVDGGTSNFTGTLTSLGKTVTLSNGGVANIAKSLTIPTLNLTGGVLDGAGAVTVSNHLTWNNGASYMVGTGSTTLAKGATMSLGGDGTNQVLEARTFNNYGSATWLANSGVFYLYIGAIFNNESGATFTVNNDQLIDCASGATGAFNNAGSFTKSGTSGITELKNVLFNNAGTVNVNKGTLQLDAGGNDSSGAFNVASGATLDFNGGFTTLASSVGTSTSPQPGAVIFAGDNFAWTDITGSYNVSGSTTVNNGRVHFIGTSTLKSLGNTVTISGGTTDITPNVTIPTLNLTGGTLTGSGDVTISKSMTWAGGSPTTSSSIIMSGTGSTSVASTATASVGGSNLTSLVLDGRTFNNAGKVSYARGTETIKLGDGAIINNEAGATFTDNGAYFFPYLGATGTFNNAGTFVANAYAWFYGSSFNNTGTVNVAANSTIELDNGGSNSGSYVLGSNALLDLNLGAFDFSSSKSSVTGAGSVVVGHFGEADFGGTYNITGETAVSGNGTANFLNGGHTGVIGSARLFQGTMELAPGTTFTVTNGNCTLYGGSIYLNGGTLALASGNALQLEQGAALYGPGTVNGDLFNGVNTIYSSSTVYVGGGQYPGTLTINGNYTQDGNSTIDVNLGGATPSTQYDQMKVSGTASLNGALTVNLVNGYSPPKGTQYSILTYALETGDFATKNLDGLTAATPGAKAYILTA